MNRFHYLGIAGALSMLCSACSFSHDRPPIDSEVVAPSQILEFSTLYAQNCAACHGAQGRGGAAIALANPVYLAIVDEPSVRKAIAGGVHGTSMPAFAQSAGGMLTEKQIDAISSGIFSHWAQKGILDGSNPPPYAATSSGNAANGELVYGSYCASCHGAGGEGGPKGSAITNDSFLALISDQGLRTIVITGRPELGAPDWRGNILGRPMTDQEITNVVAWLAAHRSGTPGQPYSAANDTQHIDQQHIRFEAQRSAALGDSKMSSSPATNPASDSTISRRGFFMKVGILFNGFAAVVLAVPIVRFVLSSASRGRVNAYLSWVPLGRTDEFPEGETRLATFRNPFEMPTDGKTVNTACWVRRVAGDRFQVFAINCAHLGCPVRWFPQSGLFMCPCHGGAYYRDGSRASGPPERGLFEYQYRIQDGILTIQAGELPTPGAAVAELNGTSPCAARVGTTHDRLVSIHSHELVDGDGA